MSVNHFLSKQIKGNGLRKTFFVSESHLVMWVVGLPISSTCLNFENSAHFKFVCSMQSVSRPKKMFPNPSLTSWFTKHNWTFVTQWAMPEHLGLPLFFVFEICTARQVGNPWSRTNLVLDLYRFHWFHVYCIYIPIFGWMFETLQHAEFALNVLDSLDKKSTLYLYLQSSRQSLRLSAFTYGLGLWIIYTLL